VATQGKTKSKPGAKPVARSYFEALAARDVDAMVSHWSPDGIEDIAGIGVLRGPHEVRDFFSSLNAALPDLEWVVERITGDTKVAAVQWRARGTFSGGQLLGLEPNGRQIDWRGCDCIEVEDGLIVRNTVYQDGLSFIRSVGLIPPQDSAAERAMFGAFNVATKLRQQFRERFAG
jgi:steroid delta-isomerase-like uncharacterized protein